MLNLVQGRGQAMEKSGNLQRGQLRQLCPPPSDCTPSGDLSPLSREPPPSPMVKKQRRKKLTTPSKTEGSAGQAEGEAPVGSYTPTLDPHPHSEPWPSSCRRRESAWLSPGLSLLLCT